MIFSNETLTLFGVVFLAVFMAILLAWAVREVIKIAVGLFLKFCVLTFDFTQNKIKEYRASTK